jgi:hypothetical protein
MSYQILRFNHGAEAQGYVLHGLGEHKGTNVSISEAELLGMTQRAQFEANRLAAILDRKFELAHADLLTRDSDTHRMAEMNEDSARGEA